ncbi:sporulation integral membrane protein YtvI [Kroppenstedtia sanguinis]|uniref:Sporulation integral membrane protein YtvI n=1 Tax=Kroppenstedtia sanguinis TaxID=1380684 RepID=A0ABW4C634_9BACL
MNREAVTGILLRTLLAIAAMVSAYYLCVLVFPLTYPFLIGGLIAMTVEPAVRWLENRARFPRWAGVTLSLIILVGGSLSLLIYLVSRIVMELTNLAEYLPQFFNQMNQYLLDTFIRDNGELIEMIHTIQNYMENNPQQSSEILTSIRENLSLVANKGTQFITDILAGIGSFLGNLPYYATVLIFIILAAFFIGIDWPRLKGRFLPLIPGRVSQTGHLVIRDLKKALFGFLRAQLTLISITGVIVWIGLSLLGVEYALTLALITGALDLLPYLGVGTVMVPWVAYLMLTGNFRLGLGIAVLYVVILVVRQTLEPKLVATNIGISPLLTLVALFIGLKLFGVFGLILGPVITVLLLVLYRVGVFHDLWNYIVHGKSKLSTPGSETEQ